MKHECSLPHSQVPASCPYPEPDQTSSCPHPTSWMSSLILSSHLSLGLPTVLPSDFSTITLNAPLLCPIRATFLVHLILNLITRIIFCEQCRSSSSSWYSLLNSLPRPSHVHISSSTPCSVTSSVYIPPSMWETEFHAHAKQRAKL